MVSLIHDKMIDSTFNHFYTSYSYIRSLANSEDPYEMPHNAHFVLTDDLQLYNYLSEIKYV